MRDIVLYTRSQLMELRLQRAHRLDDVTRQYVRATGLSRPRSRPRGCRAGKRKQPTADRARPALAVQASVVGVNTPTQPAPPPCTATLRSDDTLPSRRERHVGLPPRQLCLSTLNVRSLRNKVMDKLRHARPQICHHCMSAAC